MHKARIKNLKELTSAVLTEMEKDPLLLNDKLLAAETSKIKISREKSKTAAN